MESFQSRWTKRVAKVFKPNKLWQESGGTLKQEIEKRQLKMNYHPPKGLEKKVNIVQKEMNGHPYYVMTPKEKGAEKTILYFHGGGYVYTMSPLHWSFFSKLVQSIQCTIFIPIYPLAPMYQHKDVFEMVVPIYEEIISSVSTTNVTIMGDSAGGGISLALA